MSEGQQAVSFEVFLDRISIATIFADQSVYAQIRSDYADSQELRQCVYTGLGNYLSTRARQCALEDSTGATRLASQLANTLISFIQVGLPDAAFGSFEDLPEDERLTIGELLMERVNEEEDPEEQANLANLLERYYL